MAEVVVSAVVEVLLEKLLSGELINFARSEEISSKLNKWEKTLRMIKALLADAAQKQIKDEAVKQWLVELQDLAYDIDDVLDGMATEVMKRKFEESEATSSSSSKLLKMLPACCTSLTPHNIMYGRNINSKLDEITTRLHDLFEQRKILGLKLKKVETPDKTDLRYHQTALLPDVSEILGREGDKEALLGQLLGDEGAWRSNQNVSIVSIVGMGGIGKTTLARLLYNDPKVNDHFEVKAWVCVSDYFDVHDISKQIYQDVVGEDKTFTNLNLLHEALEKKLSNKRFLLVLDDVWNEQHDTWEALKRPLVGAPGSKILVTTRNTKVSTVMNSVQPHNLGVLSDEIALSLFARCALDEENFDKHQQLKFIAQGIVDKCKGLPLALIALGRVLKTEGSDDVQWEELLNSEIWNSQHGTNILPALKLSYYHLPSHLKQPFAYCSLFPKDFVFKKKKLILLWMAQGFLSQPKGNNQPMESLGHKYFKELLSRSFFQPVANDESLYTMHDLMNDLAISVAEEFFFLLDDKKDLNGRNEDFEKFRHFSFISQGRVVEYRKFKELHRARCLRTFLPVSTPWQRWRASSQSVILELLPDLQFLRVLSLTNKSITEVPHSIGNLKHLRYLNFSNTDIQRLPEQVGELYNLQSFLVRDCHELSSLPVSFAKLINLRHLDLTNTRSLKKMPLGIGGLTSLQTLSKVVIQEDNGFKISELKGLKDLQGDLSIEGLEKVIDPTEAKDANLQQKKGLDDLELVWGDGFRNTTNEDDVIEKLRPHSKLKTLSIIGYGGMKFPSWVGDSSFDQLTKLELRGCVNCIELTPRSFPSLGVISIKRCPKLAKVSFGLMPSLLNLTVEGCPEAVFRDLVGVSSSISRLKLKAIKGLTQLDREVLKHLGAVEDIIIKGCDELRYLWESESEACRFLGSLQNLEIRGCKKLVSINKGEKEVVNVGSSIMGSLRQVDIYECDALESYCCPNGVESLEIWKCSSMTSLSFSKLQEEDLPSSSSLKFIEVRNCKNIKSISQEHLQSLTSLEVMCVRKCPSMEDSFPSCGWLWPPNLKYLRIGELKKPMSEWGLQNYPPSLVQLILHGKHSGVASFGVMEQQDHNNTTTSSAACFLLPPSLTELAIWDFEEVESVSSEVLQHLPHLQHLYISGCPKLRDVPETTSSLRVGVYRR